MAARGGGWGCGSPAAEAGSAEAVPGGGGKALGEPGAGAAAALPVLSGAIVLVYLVICSGVLLLLKK